MHLDESKLNAYVSGSTQGMEEIRAHLTSCSTCFENYLELLELRHNSAVQPDETIVSQVLGALREHHSFVRVQSISAGIRLLDRIGNLMPSMNPPAAFAALSSHAPHTASRLGDLIIVIERQNAGFKLGLSHKNAVSAVLAYGGEDLEQLMLPDELFFQTRPSEGEYSIELRDSDNEPIHYLTIQFAS